MLYREGDYVGTTVSMRDADCCSAPLRGHEQPANIGGIFLTTVIWTTAKGFGGPYAPGSADIGSAITYTLVFVGLFLSSAGLFLGLDRWMTPRLGRFGFLASGPFVRPHFIRKLAHKENVAV